MLEFVQFCFLASLNQNDEQIHLSRVAEVLHNEKEVKIRVGGACNRSSSAYSSERIRLQSCACCATERGGLSTPLYLLTLLSTIHLMYTSITFEKFGQFWYIVSCKFHLLTLRSLTLQPFSISSG